MIRIDGSKGEGGGQMIRTALACSALTGKAFIAESIRAGRPQPGLKAQHLAGITALEKLCDAKTIDASLGSPAFTFKPGRVHGKTISIDIGTAGSITLLMQSVLLPALFADETTRFRITGGTDTKWAMPADFFSNVFLPHCRRFADIDFQLVRRGYFPKGAGRIDMRIKPKYPLSQYASLPAFLQALREEDISFETIPYKVISIKGVSHASLSLQKGNVADRTARAAKTALLKQHIPLDIAVEYTETESPGSGITLWANCSADKDELPYQKPIILGSDALGEQKVSAESVGDRAAKDLITPLHGGSTADKHLVDNLMPLLALAGGSINAPMTSHALSNIHILETFLPIKFKHQGNMISLA
ncbi:MAG: RNA 3'-terminal phosphate cyclase [Nanoarchaeota archaeon]